MVALFPIGQYWWLYAAFTAGILVLLALDLGLLHRDAHRVGIREAAGWTAMWGDIDRKLWIGAPDPSGVSSRLIDRRPLARGKEAPSMSRRTRRSRRFYPRAAAVAVMLVMIASLLRDGWARQAKPTSGGAILYRRYCAACHGLEGRGDGPAASALSPLPPDLTRLTSSVEDLMRQIDGSRTVRAHGSAAMPVWGEVFEQSSIDEPRHRRTALLHVQALADYVYRLRRAEARSGP